METKKNEVPIRVIGKKLKTINDRIEYLRRSFGYPVSAFARKLGGSKSAMINVLSDSKNEDPSFKIIKAIVKVFPVSEEWLLLGMGEPFTKDDISDYKYSEGGSESTLDPELNSRISQIRNELGLSQAMFADSIGSTRDVISFIEINRTAVTVPIVKKVIKKYNINPTWILFGEGNKYRKGH